MNDSNPSSSTDLNAPFGEQGAFFLSLLVAAGENNVIGKDNKLPWHLPNDLRYFKNLTWGMPILMGRKTFDSIGKALPGRKSIVLTRNKEWSHSNIAAVHSVEAAIAEAKNYDVKELFVIGGAELFTTTLPLANRIYLTRIHHTFEGDVFFPPVTENEWSLIQSRFSPADEKNPYPHTFQIWERK